VRSYGWRLLGLLLLEMLLLTQAFVQGALAATTPIPVKVSLGPIKNQTVFNALRVGDVCFATKQTIIDMNWDEAKDVHKAKNSLNVKIGSRSAFVEFQKINGKDYFNLRRAIESLDGQSNWSSDGKVLFIRARLDSITITKDHQAVIKSSFPVNWEVKPIAKGNRIAIDLLGGYLPSKSVPVEITPDVANVRFGAPQDQVARIVFDMKAPFEAKYDAQFLTSHIGFAWTIDLTKATETTPVAPSPPVILPPAVIGKPTWESLPDERIVIHIPTNRRVQVSLLASKEPLKVSIELINSKYDDNPIDENIKEGILKALRFDQQSTDQKCVARLGVDVGRIMGISVLAKSSEVTVILTRPRGSTGKISEKLIVIDPGHGGKDMGANTGSYKSRCDGALYREDDINLAIAEKLAATLADMGANILMTRSESAYVALYDRPKMANEAKADFFISIHTNSNSALNSMSGSYVYYHGGEISSAALAMAIQAQIGIVNELPNNGIRSDKTIYGTGFAVLRASSMPAVLVEVGYINNDNDREYLLNEEWQGKMAEAIAFGIRSYLGDGDNIALQRPDPVDQDRK